MADQLADLGGQLIDLPVQGTDVVQQDPRLDAVVVFPPAVQRRGKLGALGAGLADGQVREGLRVTLAGDQRLDHRPGSVSVQGGQHRGDLDLRPFVRLAAGAVLPVAAAVSRRPPSPPPACGYSRAGASACLTRWSSLVLPGAQEVGGVPR